MFVYLSCIADDFCLGLDEASVWDCETIKEVHEDNNNQEDKGEKENIGQRTQARNKQGAIDFWIKGSNARIYVFNLIYAIVS